MADAQCGPSNPLQNFQKKTTADRSIQQDRLLSRHPPPQSFRSNPGPTGGLLDPEFAGFQAGSLSSTFNEPPGPILQHTSPSRFGPGPVQQPTHAPGWASDFQRLNISSPQPAPALQQRQLSPPSASTSWHHDFQNQSRPLHQAAPQTFQQTPSISSTQLFQTPFAFAPPTQHLGYPPQLQQQQTPFEPLEASQQDVQFDDEAFEREFQAHTTALQELDQQADSNSMELGQDVLLDDGPDVLQSLDENAMPALANAESLDSEQQQQLQPPDTEEDDLARTARELLSRLEDNHSDKFRDSNFLSLMAQFRDGEARVEGNQIVPVQKPDVEQASDATVLTSLESPRPQARSSSVPRRGLGSSFIDRANPGPQIRPGSSDFTRSKDDRSRPRSSRAWLDELPKGHMVSDF